MKVLVSYASAGEGHKKAAVSVYEELKRQSPPGAEIILADSLDYTSKFFKFTYMMGYIFMVKYTPTLWGFFYYILDTKFFYALVWPFRRLTNWVNTRKLVKFLKKENFDVCVSAHFMMTELLSWLKMRKKINTSLVTVITDYKAHNVWLGKCVDAYIVGAEDTRQNLIQRGIPESKIRVFGIPIEKKFSVLKNKGDIIKKMSVEKHKFSVLVMGGGFGVGPIKEIVCDLQKIDLDCQILVVCGRNQLLYEQLSSLKSGFKKPTFIFGFCNNMDEIMSLSDVMISKVGGMASSESLACTLPIIGIAPIPGQEARNAKFLLRNGVGFKIKKPSQASTVVLGLLSDETGLSEIKNKISRLAKPESARDIAEFILKSLWKN
ncbi:MAG: hypothetical protein JW946_02835 [Candidatus Omnitrophica bacterium]|nr:hypothetical protein [Candidatus Omnitrophota bacterium]